MSNSYLLSHTIENIETMSKLFLYFEGAFEKFVWKLLIWKLCFTLIYLSFAFHKKKSSPSLYMHIENSNRIKNINTYNTEDK